MWMPKSMQVKEAAPLKKHIVDGHKSSFRFRCSLTGKGKASGNENGNNSGRRMCTLEAKLGVEAIYSQRLKLEVFFLRAYYIQCDKSSLMR
uniref:HTH_48 domain-containing protein n=1 Tax=Steinernema glaseri TaxID=37863 RepID=A0A1I7Z917_9BILA